MDTVDPNTVIDTQTGCCPTISQMVEKTQFFNVNPQKQLLSEYDLKFKIKSHEWAKLTADKMVLTTITSGQ